ncbi:MAG: hypothetical protein IK092_06700, partial [Muribaculaceae bacterium]|nr:hypothetical protein [Muribaculaceae bacterium]
LFFAFSIVLGLLFGIKSNALLIEYKLSDGTHSAITSSELSSIDFNDDGTVTFTTYDGQVIDGFDAKFEELELGSKEFLLPQTLDSIIGFEYAGISVGKRSVREFFFLYPTVDPQGDSITMSGRIIIPTNILNGEAPSQGLILMNHYTIFSRDQAPSTGFTTLEALFLANPLNPDYILIESDFYGFGATVRFPQAYLQGTVNAHATIDCLISCRKLLEEMGIDYGPLVFNVGYSSGGFDALATQKLRDNEFRDVIKFDKTFAGGAPSDINRCYREYIDIDSTAYNAVLAMLLVSTEDTQHLGISYDDVFQPYIAEKIDLWINSKEFNSAQVCDSIGREKKVHEILMPTYCDLESEESLEVQKMFVKNSIATDWNADPESKLYIFHSRGDDYVPIQSARPVLRHLENCGFTPSLIAGKTNLQTNFIIPYFGHLSSTLVYLVQTVSAINSWPKMYTDGVLNEEYQQMLPNDPDVVAFLRNLDNAGFNCRGLILDVMSLIEEDEDGEPSEFIAAILAKLDEMGLNKQALLEMSQ